MNRLKALELARNAGFCLVGDEGSGFDKVCLDKFESLCNAVEERGREACLRIAEAIYAEAKEVAHPDAEGRTAECVKRIKDLGEKPLAKSETVR